MQQSASHSYGFPASYNMMQPQQSSLNQYHSPASQFHQIHHHLNNSLHQSTANSSSSPNSGPVAHNFLNKPAGSAFTPMFMAQQANLSLNRLNQHQHTQMQEQVAAAMQLGSPFSAYSRIHEQTSCNVASSPESGIYNPFNQFPYFSFSSAVAAQQIAAAAAAAAASKLNIQPSRSPPRNASLEAVSDYANLFHHETSSSPISSSLQQTNTTSGSGSSSPDDAATTNSDVNTLLASSKQTKLGVNKSPLNISMSSGHCQSPPMPTALFSSSSSASSSLD